MSALAQPRWIVGRTIVDFKTNPFPDGKGGTAHWPVFHLDNGARVRFVVEETETGEYGIEPVYDAPDARAMDFSRAMSK